MSACRVVAARVETAELPPPVSGFQGTSSGDRRSPSAHSRNESARVLAERLLHRPARDFLVSLRNE
jgi:hypothetical protein